MGPAWGEGLSHVRSTTGRRENTCKGPGVGTILECLRNRLQCGKNLMKESRRVLRNQVRELGRDNITWTLRPDKEFEFYSMAMGSHGKSSIY